MLMKRLKIKKAVLVAAVCESGWTEFELIDG